MVVLVKSVVNVEIHPSSTNTTATTNTTYLNQLNNRLCKICIEFISGCIDQTGYFGAAVYRCCGNGGVSNGCACCRGIDPVIVIVGAVNFG